MCTVNVYVRCLIYVSSTNSYTPYRSTICSHRCGTLKHESRHVLTIYINFCQKSFLGIFISQSASNLIPVSCVNLLLAS